MKKCFLVIILFCTLSCQNREDWTYPGVFFGFAVDGFPVTDQMLESKISPEMIVFYLQWLKPHPSIISSLDTIWKLGAVPCLTWEPMLIGDKGEKMIPYDDILSGKYDPYLSSMADIVKQWGKPLIIRFAQEMNISRYHWGTAKEDFGPNSPEIYIKMFQYIVKLFKGQKADNVLWAFCPNVDSIPNEPWNEAKMYYPGDEFVDILGMDGYNWKESPWRTFQQIFSPLYQELRSISSHKPIIVFETATVSRAEDPTKRLWVQEALEVAKKWGIKGIVWFQVKKEEDWRIDPNYIQPTNPSFQNWLLTQWILNR